MALKVFEVEITVTKTVRATGTIYVLAESAAQINKLDTEEFENHADREDEDVDDVDLIVTEAKSTPPRDASLIVRDGELDDADEDDYEEAEGEQPIIDDRTLPLALPRVVAGKVVVERVTAVPFYPSREVR